MGTLQIFQMKNGKNCLGRNWQWKLQSCKLLSDMFLETIDSLKSRSRGGQKYLEKDLDNNICEYMSKTRYFALIRASKSSYSYFTKRRLFISTYKCFNNC